MPNPPIRLWETLATLKKGQLLEFECGRCGRTALVTLLQLVRRNIGLDTPIERIRQKSFCKRCGRPDPKNRVRVRNGRD
jgi:ribosomal protein S27AE